MWSLKDWPFDLTVPFQLLFLFQFQIIDNSKLEISMGLFWTKFRMYTRLKEL